MLSSVTVAIDESLTLHFIFPSQSEGSTDARNWSSPDCASTSVPVRAVSEIPSTSDTVTASSAFTSGFSAVTVIVAFPAEIPFTTPSSLTVATASSLDFQVNLSVLPRGSSTGFTS